MTTSSRGPVHWLGVAVIGIGVVLMALGAVSYLFGSPTFDSNPVWVGAVCVLLGWGALSVKGDKRSPDDVP